MKTLALFVAVCLLASIIDAAPKRPSAQPNRKSSRVTRTEPKHKSAPRSVPSGAKGAQSKGGKSKRQFPLFFQGGSVYPNYFVQPSAPLVDFQKSFLEAAFLSGVHFTDLEKQFKNHNFTDSSGKPLPLDARAAAAFEDAFGDKQGNLKGATDLKARIIAPDGFGNINIVNPFLLAKDIDGKLLRAEGGLPGFKAGKLGDVNSSLVEFISSFPKGRVDAIFGPEIAPRYEIHYTPQGVTLDPLPLFAGGAGLSSAIGVAPVGLTGIGSPFGPSLGPFPAFGVAPSFNSLLSPYPYPYPFLPGFGSKGLKPNGKNGNGNGNGNTSDSTDQPTETTSEGYQEVTSESAPSDSSSEPTSESPASDAPQQ